MPAMVDPNVLFQSAEQAFGQRRYTDARRALDQVEPLIGRHPAILHLRALVEQNAGHPDRALAAFQEARRLAPQDPQIANNHGNLLDAMGRIAEAVHAYDDAIRLAPGDADARINRGLTLQKAGDLPHARSDFDAALALKPSAVRALIGWAALERQAGDLDKAAELYDRALAVAPASTVALHGRALVAAGRGEPDASARYRSLQAAAPADPDLLMGLVEALDAEGDPAGRGLLAAFLETRPDWAEGHSALARMRADAAEDIALSFEQAIAARPRDRLLREAYWRTLVHAERHPEALAVIQATRAALGADRTLVLEEAAVASEAGEVDRAEQLLGGLGETADVWLVRGRLALRRGQPDRAVADLERVTARQPDAINGWAHLGLAWRLLDDPRVEWLYGQPGLWSVRQLELEPHEIQRLADVLRAIHRSRAAPLGQSLRGGTQTRGRLLARLEPEIRLLGKRLHDAIAAHVGALPRADQSHPLLRHRDATFRFSGSWSVRLRDGGRHVAHVHPEGLLSSACYIALPTEPGPDPWAGWLELGRPPTELGLSLEPLTTIKPQPGRLALFPSYFHHGTRPFVEGERLTVAFDLMPT